MSLKKIYKNILITTGKAIFLLVSIISMAFVNNELKKKKIEDVCIKIVSDNHPMMCCVEDIEKYLRKHYTDLTNKQYSDIDYYTLENILNEKNEVKNTAVYLTQDRTLYIQITERKPIARIMSAYNINHYIDDEWKIFKVTTPYPVPLIVGEFYENPNLFKHYPIYKILQSSELSTYSLLDDVYLALNVILTDTVIRHFIDYMYIHHNQDITIYPIVGKFQIEVGTSEYFQAKMNKLKLFIQHGLNKNDAWNKYAIINLKYKNLIYCTKK